uniref:Doublecortin domain-containing protein n=1 Tax=Ditylenchus dipsaci TaxID=166011 RepID=A0A915D9S1_9BILA
MLITPSVYDPFTNNISFVELNKKRRRQQHHTPPAVLSIFICRNGNLHSTPKEFEWRPLDCNQLNDFLKAAGEQMKMKTTPQLIYDEHGQIVKDLGQLVNGQTYVLGNVYDRLSPPKVPTENKQSAEDGNDQDTDSHKNSLTSSKLSNNARYYSGVGLITHLIEDAFSPYGSWISSEFDNAQLKQSKDDRAIPTLQVGLGDEANDTGKKENKGVNQSNSVAYIIYTFLNGQGIKCRHIKFARKQLQQGMRYVMELIAQLWMVKPRMLVNMGGKKIHRTSELMSRGAYVIVPSGQNFRETWYFLPDHAIDTSEGTADQTTINDQLRNDTHISNTEE